MKGREVAYIIINPLIFRSDLGANTRSDLKLIAKLYENGKDFKCQNNFKFNNSSGNRFKKKI